MKAASRFVPFLAVPLVAGGLFGLALHLHPITIRTVAVDVTLDPRTDTVVRTYRELQIAGAIETRRRSDPPAAPSGRDIPPFERQRMLDQLVTEIRAGASGYGLSLEEVVKALTRPAGEDLETPVAPARSAGPQRDGASSRDATIRSPWSSEQLRKEKTP